MFTWIFFVDLFLATLLVMIGAVVLARNGQSTINKLCFSTLLAFAGWIMVNYFSNNQYVDAGYALIANHLVLFMPGLALVLLLRLVVLFVNSGVLIRYINHISVVLYAIYFLSLTPLVLRGIVKQENVYAINFGSLSSVYFAGLLLNAVLIFVALSVGVKNSEGLQRRKIITLFGSFSVTILINLVTNALIPYFGGFFLLTNLGPMSAIIIAIGLFYGITKQKLFNMHFFAVRAAAYVFTLVVLTILYAIPSVLLVLEILDVEYRWSAFAWSVVSVLLLAGIYGWARTYFNNMTNRIFFRGYYEPQEILNQLSEILVKTIDADKVKADSADLLKGALKTKNFRYWLSPNSHTFSVLTKLFLNNKQENIIVLDEYDGDPFLMQALQDESIAVAVRLRTTHDDLGFITLGFKESGQLYNGRDKRLLAIAADEIAISLQNSLRFEEIQNFNVTLRSRIEEATRQLRASNAKLKAIDETKDDFISMASHQLRTPLTSVKGYLSLVLDGDAGRLTPRQRKMLTQSYISSQRMVYLIADLLNVSRLKTGKFVIEPIRINLAKVVADEVRQLKETAESRGLTINYVRPTDFPDLMLDETKIHQVIMNFIDNAIYYTPSGGSITIELLDKPTSIELHVTDTGIGVPKAEQHHLFTKFYRAANAKRARPDGTGLGLFMARKVVLTHGGAIIFSSREGKGSTFGFTFPKRKILPPSSTSPAATTEKVVAAKT
jgi:signal transduction histidine kinase